MSMWDGARCTQMGPQEADATFFTGDLRHQEGVADTMCGPCPAIVPCLARALNEGMEYGVVGGTTWSERFELWKAHPAADWGRLLAQAGPWEWVQPGPDELTLLLDPLRSRHTDRGSAYDDTALFMLTSTFSQWSTLSLRTRLWLVDYGLPWLADLALEPDHPRSVEPPVVYAGEAS